MTTYIIYENGNETQVTELIFNSMVTFCREKHFIWSLTTHVHNDNTQVKILRIGF